MALLKYVMKNFQEDISVAFYGSELNDAAEENEAKQQLFLDAPEPKKKMVIHDFYNEQELQTEWGIAHGKRPAARSIRYESLLFVECKIL